MLSALAELLGSAGAAGIQLALGLPGIQLPGFRRTVKSSSSKNVDAISHQAKQLPS